MRTQEQIIADCEKRYAELCAEKERIYNDPQIQRPCPSCRFYSMVGDDGFNWNEDFPQYHTCTEPLVQGYRQWGVRIGKRNPPFPCGPEKALWQPKLPWWKRFMQWLGIET